MKKTILLSGGGTLGPVTPLLALVEVWRKGDAEIDFVFVGTPSGPERELVEAVGIPFYTLSTPKLSRHQKWQWPFLPPLLALSFARSLSLLRSIRPDAHITAGGYTSVPLAFAGKLLGIPLFVHQLDQGVGLANKLMAPLAKRITVTFEESLAGFGAEKALVVGAVVRPSIKEGDVERARKRFGLLDRKTILVLGGGTGSIEINTALSPLLPELTKSYNVLHITGKGKGESAPFEGEGYRAVEFLGAEIADAYALADIVVARAGMGTILELSALRKASVFIPLRGTTQVANATKLRDAGACEMLLHVNPQILKQAILRLLEDPARTLSTQTSIARAFPPNGAETLVKLVNETLGS